MCGIFGYCPRSESSELETLARRVKCALQHRGPDDYGWLVSGAGGVQKGRGLPPAAGIDLLLLHTRLSILDLSEAGWQPASTPDGRYHIVYNGEIYNFIELRAELEALGWTFRSHSDTEVLLYAYAQWGPAVLSRLVGMFAFAVFDARERKVFLARDFFGIKPLFYVAGPQGFAFASEVKALLEVPGVGRRVNPGRLYDYLYWGITDFGSETMFADVRQLPAAHHVTIDLNRPQQVEPVRYWRPERTVRRDLSFGEAAETLRGLFLDSIRLHLRSDVPVGVALSGGIDSSAIAMAVRQAEPTLDLHTFTFASGAESINEERWADIVAGAAGATSHKVRLTPEDLAGDLDRLIRIHDEPFGSTSIYAQYRVFQMAREAGATVMLDGQGADELLAGYPLYLAPRLAGLLRRGRLADAARFVAGIRRLPGTPFRAVLHGAARLAAPGALVQLLRYLQKRSSAPGWMDAEWFAERGAVGVQSGMADPQPDLRQHLLHSVDAGLPKLLRYEDRNSMAHSIESRVPFLTPEFAEFALSLPPEYIIGPTGTTKAVFREAMRGIVPDAVLDRKDKVGFETEERSWILARKSWVDQVLRSETAAGLGAIRHPAVLADWEAVVQGRQPFDSRVWRWINVIRWSEIFSVDMA